jgi:arsenate reductase
MNKKNKILILCTGNSCRSQMAEGFLKSFDNELEVYSAGTKPSGSVHPKAIQVMNELNLDISLGYPQHVEDFIDKDFDYVITVCGGAKESCPMFEGKVKKQLHIGFDDPAEAKGTEDHILDEFRRVRDEIKRGFNSFYNNNIKKY